MRLPLTLSIKKKNKTEQLPFSIPTTWGDVTLGQAIKLQKFDFKAKGAKIDLIAILSDIPRDKLKLMPPDALAGIEEAMSFLSEEPNLEQFTVPASVHIDGKDYQVPKDLKLETFGQKVCVEEALRNMDAEASDLIDLMPYVLSVYFSTMISGQPFDDEKVPDYEDLMKTIPIRSAYPVASFFLTRYGGLSLTKRVP